MPDNRQEYLEENELAYELACQETPVPEEENPVVTEPEAPEGSESYTPDLEEMQEEVLVETPEKILEEVPEEVFGEPEIEVQEEAFETVIPESSLDTPPTMPQDVYVQTLVQVEPRQEEEAPEDTQEPQEFQVSQEAEVSQEEELQEEEATSEPIAEEVQEQEMPEPAKEPPMPEVQPKVPQEALPETIASPPIGVPEGMPMVPAGELIYDNPFQPTQSEEALIGIMEAMEGIEAPYTMESFHKACAILGQYMAIPQEGRDGFPADVKYLFSSIQAKKDQVDHVHQLMHAIPEVYTLESEDRIQAFQEAFDPLTEDVKVLVQGLELLEQPLAESKKMRLMISEMEAAIENIKGPYGVTDTIRIQNVENLWESLSEDIQGLVNEEIRKHYYVLKSMNHDAYELNSMITNLPAVYSKSVESQVELAVEKYLALSEDAKCLVCNRQKLADLELMQHSDQQKITEVTEGIMEIVLPYREFTIRQIELSKLAVEELTVEQRELVAPEVLQTLGDLIGLKEYSQDASQQIADLPEKYNSTHKEAVLAMDLFVSKVPPEKRGMIAGLGKLDFLMNAMENDDGIIGSFVHAIAALEPPYSEETLFLIREIQACHDGLGAEQLEAVPEETTVTYQELCNKLARVEEMNEKISVLPASYAKRFEQVIESAREAFDALPEEDRDMVSDVDILFSLIEDMEDINRGEDDEEGAALSFKNQLHVIGGTELDVKVWPKLPRVGMKVGIKPLLKDNRELLEVIVTTEGGEEIEVMKKPDGTLFFIQPQRSLVITVKIEDNSPKIPLSVLVNGWSNCYRDIKEKDWFYQEVAYCTMEELISCPTAALFDPHGIVNRGVVAKALYEFSDSPTPRSVKLPKDMQEAQNEILWVSENKIIMLYNDGSFHPEHTVTREQLMSYFYEYAKYRGLNISQHSSLAKFKDRRDISAYAKEAVEWAIGKDLVRGRKTKKLLPDKELTRAELAVFMARLRKIC